MIIDDKLEASMKKVLRDIYIGSPPTFPEEPPSLLRNCICWGVSLCLVMVIVASLIASL